MARKRKTYIAHWRRFHNLSRGELADKLIAYAAETGEKGLPATEASLSRIEDGTQNFKVNFLEAVAAILGMERPGDLLDRNPFEGMAQVISMVDRMSDVQRKRAADVLQAVFGDETA